MHVKNICINPQRRKYPEKVMLQMNKVNIKTKERLNLSIEMLELPLELGNVLMP